MKREVWVFAEHKNGRIRRVTFELLGQALELGARLEAQVAAILVGSGVEKLTGELASYGAAKIYLVENTRLAFYQSEAYASIVADLIAEHTPEIFLLGSTDTGKDLAPRVAAKAGTGLTAHCIDLKVLDNQGVPLLCQIVPGWSGEQSFGIICPQKRPQMATVKPGVFDMPPRVSDKKAEIVRVSPVLTEKLFRAETVEVIEEPPAQALEEFEVVIGVGWGAYGLGDLEPVKELAKAIGGGMGGTRPMIDKGWLTQDRMIGQSGKIVSPKIFIGLGASGAMHFTTGFERAKFIIAVDQNPEAPIFKIADIGIVGDLREVLPRLTEELSKLKEISRPS